MSQCPRCRRYYYEPPEEQGDHDCPSCGLTPEHRGLLVWDKERKRFVEPEEREESAQGPQ